MGNTRTAKNFDRPTVSRLWLSSSRNIDVGTVRRAGVRPAVVCLGLFDPLHKALDMDQCQR